MRLSTEAKRQIARAYTAGKLTKVIAHEFGISPTHVSRVAHRVGAVARATGRPRQYRPTVQECEVLRLFRAGLDTISIAARLGANEPEVASALARARDRERGQ